MNKDRVYIDDLVAEFGAEAAGIAWQTSLIYGQATLPDGSILRPWAPEFYGPGLVQMLKEPR